MRLARVLGLSPDGQHVLLATDNGKKFAIAVDDRLRSMLRRERRPRPKQQLGSEMGSALSPREIQNRIRSGESVDEVATASNMERDRVERFAAPVLAEREHVAGLALTSTARRRGETSAHRTLSGAANQHWRSLGLDPEEVQWDAYRMPDGRWAVTADYQSGNAATQAAFLFDLPGRYSVAANESAQLLLGDAFAGRTSTTPGSVDDLTSEPTVDLSDELALVRAIQDRPVRLTAVTPVRPGRLAAEDLMSTAPEASPAESAGHPEPEPVFELPSDLAPDPESATMPEPLTDISPVTSDAVAVPELTAPLKSSAWEPAIVCDYPVEPGVDLDAETGEVPEGSDSPGRPEPPVAAEDRRDEADAIEFGGDAVSLAERTDVPPAERSLAKARSDAATGGASTEDQDQPALDLPDQPTPTPARPARRKRAAVPSWDEIVFGGPR